MQHVAERAGGLSVRCQGLVHLYKTFEGHDGRTTGRGPHGRAGRRCSQLAASRRR
jgi:hypothetical protein